MGEGGGVGGVGGTSDGRKRRDVYGQQFCTKSTNSK